MSKPWCHTFRKLCQKLLEILSLLVFVVSSRYLGLCLKLPYYICLCWEMTLSLWRKRMCEPLREDFIASSTKSVTKFLKKENQIHIWIFFLLTQQQWLPVTKQRNLSGWWVNWELMLGKYLSQVLQVSVLFPQNKRQKWMMKILKKED